MANQIRKDKKQVRNRPAAPRQPAERAEDGSTVTDEMIAGWESALERGEWPSGWANVGEIVEWRIPRR